MTQPDKRSLIETEMVRRGLSGIRPGLDRIAAVCAALGHPEARLGRIVHVAGTNGKGSVCAYLEATCRAAGLSTALFTSPHLVRATERVRLDGADIASDAFDRACRTVMAVEQAIAVELTGFELVTAAGFVAMADHAPDVAIVEVGLGGGLDATNVVMPALAVVTPIALDHAHFLGTTLTSVARAKAGIIKPAVPCVSAAQQEEARLVIEARARQEEAPLTFVDQAVAQAGDDGNWSARVGALALGPLQLALPGSFQCDNAALAALAATQLGLGLDGAAIAAGLRTARWPGRFHSATFRGRPLLLDGGHNPHAMTAFISAYRRRFEVAPQVLFALKEDKDVAAMVSLLDGFAASVICTRAGAVASVPPEDLVRLFQRTPAEAEPDLHRALDLLVAREGNNVGVCCGSFYLVGALLERLAAHEEMEP